MIYYVMAQFEDIKPFQKFECHGDVKSLSGQIKYTYIRVPEFRSSYRDSKNELKRSSYNAFRIDDSLAEYVYISPKTKVKIPAEYMNEGETKIYGSALNSGVCCD